MQLVAQPSAHITCLRVCSMPTCVCRIASGLRYPAYALLHRVCTRDVVRDEEASEVPAPTRAHHCRLVARQRCVCSLRRNSAAAFWFAQCGALPRLRRGDEVLLNIIGFFRDTSRWKDAHKFMPDRFDERSPVCAICPLSVRLRFFARYAAHSHRRYGGQAAQMAQQLVFGGGRRCCVGGRVPNAPQALILHGG